MNWWTSLLLAGSIATIWAGEIDSASLLARVQAKVRDNARRIPRYVCRQKIERQSFVPVKKPSRTCVPEPEEGFTKPPGSLLVVADRAHLDVLLAQGTELFSWPGATSFDTDTPADLLGGGLSGSGDFAGFVISVFTVNQVTFDYLGPCGGGECVRYRYNMPQELSHYILKTPVKEEATLGYHGTFDVNPQSADLLGMTVVPTDLSKALLEVCDIRTRMTYTRTTMQASEFMIPESTEMEYMGKDGAYSLNRVSYESCRQYMSQSTLSFGDEALRTVPQGQTKVSRGLPVAGTELRLQLASKINSDVSSAGDSLEAKLVRAVRDTEGGTIPVGTVIRGHLAELERVYFPPRQVVAIRFDTIVLSGAPVPLIIDPIGKMDQRGRGIFIFAGKRLVLGKEFVSRWRVRSQAP